MADSKKAGKNRKYGRNCRNNRNVLQRARTTANKAKRVGAIPSFPKIRKEEPLEHVMFTGQVEDLRWWKQDSKGERYVFKMPTLVIKNGVTINSMPAKPPVRT